MKFRASSVAPLFLGNDGLTAIQQRDLNDLLNKIKLTEKQAEKRDELIAKRDAPIELSQGAKSLVESIVEQEVYKYKQSFSSKQTDKGTRVEDESIEVYNRLFFTDYKKLVEGDKYAELSIDLLSGHPDIVSIPERKVIDIKSSWDKSTFPKLPEQAKNSTYEWQVKSYLYMMSVMTGEEWTRGEVAFVLVNTPEDLLNEWDEESLHYVDDLEDNLRVTIVNVELTIEDKLHIEKRLKAALEYANIYRNKLNNK
jgi:hypothetical protein